MTSMLGLSIVAYILPRSSRVLCARGAVTSNDPPPLRRAKLEDIIEKATPIRTYLTTQGDLAQGTAEVHVLLLEGCGAQGVLCGGFVAGLAKRLLVERGLRRPPPGRRRAGAPLLLLRGDEAGRDIVLT